MAENRCAKCGIPTGTKHRYCREHKAEYMRDRRRQQIAEMKKAGYVIAQGIIETANLMESSYKRQALLEGVQELISQKLRSMKRKRSRSSSTTVKRET